MKSEARSDVKGKLQREIDRIGIAVWCGVICISVAFVKQHSVVDIFAAIPMCLFAEWFVFFRKKK